MDEVLIAPCGMNCGICMAYLRKKNRCIGCRSEDPEKWISRLRCSMRNCETIKNNSSGFCYECDEFPCRRLKHIDKRYRTKYGMSMIENLEYIRDNGMAAFLEREQEKWKCPECGGVISCHNGVCYSCGLEKLGNKKDK
jgi:hypothetical protein